MRVVFMGTPQFSVPALDALIAAGHQIVAVYCQPARRAGRGKALRPSAVQSRAEEMGLVVRHPEHFRDPSVVAEFAALRADVAVVVAYGLILPVDVLQAPKRGCLNIHASLLPRWRGAAPIQRAIMAGDEKSGISIMQMDSGLDTGPVLLCGEQEIGTQTTSGELSACLSALGAELIVTGLDDMATLQPSVQSQDGVTYASKIDKAEARVDWRQDAIDVDRQIRGLSPFPGAWCEIAGERLKILKSELSRGSGKPGEILNASMDIACGNGSLSALLLQRAGKSVMTAQEFWRGTGLAPGAILT